MGASMPRFDIIYEPANELWRKRRQTIPSEVLLEDEFGSTLRTIKKSVIAYDEIKRVSSPTLNRRGAPSNVS